MADKEERDDQEKNRSDAASTGGGSEGQTGDPGRTPGTAEGDEQTVDEDLRQKEEQGQI